MVGNINVEFGERTRYFVLEHFFYTFPITIGRTPTIMIQSRTGGCVLYKDIVRMSRKRS